MGGTAAVTARRQRVGLVRDRAVGGQRAPVVADEHRVLAATERLVQRVGVLDDRADLVAAVRGHLRGCVAAQEGRHRPEPCGRELGQQIAPGVCGVGEPVQAQCQRPVVGPVGEVGELQPVCGDGPLFHG